MGETLQVSFPGGKRVDVVVGGRTVATDQSVKAGGNGSAPEPFSLFLASIAGCAGIYALNFCQSRELSTEGLGLTMTWERDEQRPLETKARLQLRLPAGFPDKYRGGILKAMDLCAVKKQIQNPPEFFTEILD
jgi:uncharacterized OsmC-like protein